MSSSHSPQDKLILSKKKFNKRKHRLEERLQKAREAQQRSEERLRLAQERLQIKSARVQLLERRLLALQASRTRDSSAIDESDSAGSSVFDDEEEVVVAVELESSPEHDLLVQKHNERASRVMEEAHALARDAREIALVAEEAARVAVERAEYADLRLEQSSMGRHLEGEYERMQVEVERAQILATEMAQAADEAEHLLLTFVPEEDNTFVDVEVEDLAIATDIIDDEALETNSMFDEIDKDEDAFAAVASLILADAAADQAAESEALIEASSEHTQDIHELLKQAQHTLALVRQAVEEGTLSGQDAIRALCAAELEVTHTRALLKDVEEGLEEDQHATSERGPEAR
ncbi:hypothetical protein KDA_13650 [Dictyobacter alpinus]|uniref:Uncharacterized protein n=1 Tax=Dictyobacter alpinus TaxID=2014873 RepID=A0A402B3F2_9CHLR|nr:hypothetical protein [Dictyobacter alpinus]GCE25881.1 hypothetical protein KDA_13650 [Dictyobacter alpinus]